jgi:hypothetical protein
MVSGAFLLYAHYLYYVEDVVCRRLPPKLLGCCLFLLANPLLAAQLTASEEPREHLGYINIIGKIEPQDGLEFRKVAQGLIARGNTIHQVILCTQGGNVQAAKDIGNQIKLLRASTKGPNHFANEAPGDVQCWPMGPFATPLVLRKNTQTRTGDQNADCASACFLIWSSGLTRDGNYIGVHRFYFDPLWYGALSAEAAKAQYDQEMVGFKQFLLDRDVPISIIEKLFATDAASMYYLNQGELKLMQTVPYLEEFNRAQCGELRDRSEFDANGNWLGTTYDTRWRECARKVLKEIEIAGVKAYSSEVQPGDDSNVPQAPGAPAIAPANPPGLAVDPEKAVTDNRTSNWNFFGSKMYMTTQGAQRRLFYDAPRESLSNLGITRGSLLFEGTLNQSKLTGQLIAYASNCPVLQYPATGTLSADGLRITLVGNRPTRDSACNVIGQKAVTLVLEFAR